MDIDEPTMDEPKLFHAKMMVGHCARVDLHPLLGTSLSSYCISTTIANVVLEGEALGQVGSWTR